MSGLFSATPSPAIPSFLAPAAPAAAAVHAMNAAPAPAMTGETWAPAQTVELMSLQQELERINAEITRLLASIGALVPPSTPSVIGQTWNYISNLFTGNPTPSAPAPTPQPPKPTPNAGGATKFVLSSFNVLSTNAGKGKGYAHGVQRIHSVEEILKANKVSVVGFQEMDAAQLNEFKKIAGDEYGTFAGSSGKKGYHDTTIAWRKDSWKKVTSGHITVPSYAGRDSKVPYVRLKNKQTGQEAYFVNVHNPANTKNYHNQDRFRNEAARREAELVDRLIKETGLPVFLVGDFNSVPEARDIVTRGADVKAANAETGKRAGIDWIFGSKQGVDFSKFRRTREGQIARTTDHPVLFTNVKIGGR